ncbi:hypothetical protein KSU19_22790, partial [Enterobacter quasiroggenkampii]|uniref:hypothetical protein n=1 Tax=Enterobacter quasiroggenkampii TaxID=2497436 RepID=UPI003B97DE27|nr:hypothetical protein [Enterobacter quasiroggenkampii]
AIGGPQAVKPRLGETLIGAGIKELLNDATKTGGNRLIFGSGLSGRPAVQAHAYLAVSFTHLTPPTKG